MKPILFVLTCATAALFSFSPAARAADLPISQTFETLFYSEGMADVFADATFSFLDQELRAHRCLQAKSSVDVKKKVESSIFSKDVPGVLALNYRTECVGTDLKSVRFAVDSFGYDEDYSWVVLELKTATGVTYPKICVSPFTGKPTAEKFCWSGPFQVPAKFSRAL